jgi:hypothetical protein
MAVFQLKQLADANNDVDVVAVSLRDALKAANVNSGQEVIRFDADLSGARTPAETEIPSLCTLMATIATKL